ncbi:MAG TPA: tetraacyldisaccharide 4'-kinase [Longimicrobiales bacterium]|nr:tetraacyldisaccharide 4'-kinase [Longimicrobiales bacterium]
MSGRLSSLPSRYWAGQLAGSRMLDVALAPAEALFRAGTALRNAAYDRRVLASRRAPVPVVSVGNIAVGGSGKTPFAQWIARALHARGARPAIVHGGYAADEPALHRRWSPDIPVVVDRDRLAAARAAAQQGATVIVLDDAFQHRRLYRDLDIVLVTVEGFEQHYRLLPRGPWREPLDALRRADLVIAARRTAAPTAGAALTTFLQLRTRAPLVQVYFHADAWLHNDAAAPPPAQPALVVCAIADPLTFSQSVRPAGAVPADWLPFPDHHDYTPADAAAILQRARGRPIVTTEKDWTKLDRLLEPSRVWILTQSVVVEQGADQLAAALDRVVA